MFVFDFLSRFSSDNQDEEPIPYLTYTFCLDNVSYISYLDSMCNFNYETQQGICTKHSFPLTRSQAKLQKIAIPSLFKGGMMASGPKQRPSLIRDPLAVQLVNGLQHYHLLIWEQQLLRKRDMDDNLCTGTNNQPLPSLKKKQMFYRKLMRLC